MSNKTRGALYGVCCTMYCSYLNLACSHYSMHPSHSRNEQSGQFENGAEEAPAAISCVDSKPKRCHEEPGIAFLCGGFRQPPSTCDPSGMMPSFPLFLPSILLIASTNLMTTQQPHSSQEKSSICLSIARIASHREDLRFASAETHAIRR